ncbi:type IV secretion system protein [Achromobacter aloeverae]
MDSLLDIVRTAFDAIPTAGQSLADIFKEEGLSLAAMCASISIIYYGTVQWLLGDDFKTFKINAFIIIFRLGIALVILQTMNGVPRDMFVTATKEATQKISPSAGDPASILQITIATVATIRDGTSRDATTLQACLIAQSGLSLNPLNWIFDPLPDQCKGKDNVTIFDILKNLPVILLTLILQGIAIVATALMAVAFIGVVLISKILLEIGLVLGPILIGLAILPYFNNLFDSWIRFMLNAAMQQLVVWLMTVFVMTAIVPAMTFMLHAINKAAPNADTVFAQNEVAMLCIAILSAIGAYLMWQVPSITQGLLSGTSGATAGNMGRGAIGRTIRRITRI